MYVDNEDLLMFIMMLGLFFDFLLYNKSSTYPLPPYNTYNKTGTHPLPSERYIICERPLKSYRTHCEAARHRQLAAKAILFPVRSRCVSNNASDSSIAQTNRSSRHLSNLHARTFWRANRRLPRTASTGPARRTAHVRQRRRQSDLFRAALSPPSVRRRPMRPPFRSGTSSASSA